MLHAKKTAFVVEHDFIMATYLADRVVVFEGQPSICTKANRWDTASTVANIASMAVIAMYMYIYGSYVLKEFKTFTYIYVCVL